MKSLKITTILIICSFIFFSFSCGDNPIENAQDFTQNRAPVINEFTSSPEIVSELVPGMIFSISVNADDPEGRNITYEFISESGSFMNRVISGNTATIDFITGDILPGQRRHFPPDRRPGIHPGPGVRPQTVQAVLRDQLSDGLENSRSLPQGSPAHRQCRWDQDLAVLRLLYPAGKPRLRRLGPVPELAGGPLAE